MRKITPIGRDRVGRWLVLAAAIIVATISATASAQAKDRKVANSELTLWQAVTALAQQIPFSKNKVETALGMSLGETHKDEYAVFYGAKDVPLAGGGRISEVDLRLPTKAGHPGFLVLSVEGTCVTLDQVRQHYEALEITDMPRGRSLDEVTSHTARLAWGTLSFSFPERNRQCLVRIAFDPAKG